MIHGFRCSIPATEHSTFRDLIKWFKDSFGSANRQLDFDLHTGSHDSHLNHAWENDASGCYQLSLVSSHGAVIPRKSVFGASLSSCLHSRPSRLGVSIPRFHTGLTLFSVHVDMFECRLSRLLFPALLLIEGDPSEAVLPSNWGVFDESRAYEST